MTRLNDDARWLVKELADTKRMAKALGKPQLATSSIEGGKIEEYDRDGNLSQIIGEQHDGTHASATVGGPVPPEPVAPSVTVGFGSAEVRANGKFAGGALSPMDFSHFSAHASRVEVFSPDNDTKRADIAGEAGDLAVILLDPGSWTIGLVAVSKAGKWSSLSETVTVEVPDFPEVQDIQDALDDLDEKYDGVITEAGTLGTRLDQAEADITSAESGLADAGTRLDDAFGKLGEVDTKATAAAGVASSAQSKADTAKSAADQAAADALAASGLAGSKGQVIYQASAPTGTRANAANLWIRTSDNKPHTYDAATSKWVAVTDKAATDAATAAATAKSAADAAAAAALAAQQAAGTAQSTADNALTMAGSKARVYYSDKAPSGTASTNDIWRQINATKDVIGEWYWDGGWVKTLVSSQAISNLDVGKLTVGTGIISDLVAEHIAGRSARFIQLDVSQLVAVTGTMSEAVINKLFTDVVMSRKLTAEMIAVGSFDNLNKDPAYEFDSMWRAVQAGPGSGWVTSPVFDGAVRSAKLTPKTAQSTMTSYMYIIVDYLPVKAGDWYLAYSQVQSDAIDPTVTSVDQRLYFYDVNKTLMGGRGNSSGGSVTAENWKANEWIKVGGTPVEAPPGAVYMSPRLTVYRGTNAPVNGTNFYVGPLTVNRAMDGKVVVDGTILARHADLQSFAADTGFIADLTARIVKSDMFVGKEFIGGVFTGSTFQTSILPDQGLKLDENGFRAYGPEGGEPVAEIRPDGGRVYSVIDPVTGDTLAGLDADGGVTGKTLNIEGEAIIGGSPLIGGTGVDSFSTDYGQGVLDFMPRAMVARGYRDTTGLAVTNGERAFLELSYDNLPNRAYQLHITPAAIYVPPNGGYTYLNIRHTRDGSRPTLDSPLLHRISARNGGTGSLLTPFGGTFYDLGSAGKVRYLFSWEAIDGQSSFFGGAGATFRVWVEDIGYAVPETGLGRGDGRSNGSGGTTVTPAPPAPSTPEPENYTQVWTPSGYRSYDGNSHYTYADGKNRLYQGDGPVTGMLRSIATFGGGSKGQTIFQALNGATVTSMTVEITFPHWHYGIGGTAQLTVHGQSSLPSTLPSVSLAATRAKIPRGGRVKFAIPSNRWNEFKSGSLRGIGLGNGGGGNTYYGFAKGSSIKLEIKYTK